MCDAVNKFTFFTIFQRILVAARLLNALHLEGGLAAAQMFDLEVTEIFSLALTFRGHSLEPETQSQSSVSCQVQPYKLIHGVKYKYFSPSPGSSWLGRNICAVFFFFLLLDFMTSVEPFKKANPAATGVFSVRAGLGLGGLGSRE